MPASHAFPTRASPQIETEGLRWRRRKWTKYLGTWAPFFPLVNAFGSVPGKAVEKPGPPARRKTRLPISFSSRRLKLSVSCSRAPFLVSRNAALRGRVPQHADSTQLLTSIITLLTESTRASKQGTIFFLSSFFLGPSSSTRSRPVRPPPQVAPLEGDGWSERGSWEREMRWQPCLTSHRSNDRKQETKETKVQNRIALQEALRQSKQISQNNCVLDAFLAGQLFPLSAPKKKCVASTRRGFLSRHVCSPSPHFPFSVGWWQQKEARIEGVCVLRHAGQELFHCLAVGWWWWGRETKGCPSSPSTQPRRVLPPSNQQAPRAGHVSLVIFARTSAAPRRAFPTG